MSIALALRSSGNTARQLAPTLILALLGSVAAFAPLLLPLSSLSAKVVYSVSAALLCAAGAVLSGNIRLYSLWCLMFTLPLDYSMHFGAMIKKMGGENQFRVEASDIFLAALAIYVMRDIWQGRRSGLRIPRVVLIWSLIILMGVAATVIGPYRTSAAQETLRMIKVIVLFVVVTNELNSDGRILQAVTALAASAAFEGAIGLVQQYRGRLLGLGVLGEVNKDTVLQLASDSVQGVSVFRVSAFLLHPNVFGIFLAAVLPLAIGGLLIRRSLVNRGVLFMCVALGCPALIATLSRSSWVGFTVACIVLFSGLCAHRGLRQRAVLFMAVCAIAAMVPAVVYFNKIASRVLESQAGATIARSELSFDAWQLIGDKPWVGWGINSYALNVPLVMRLSPRQSHKMWGTLFPVVHNVYLLWWMELGLLGLLLHLLVWGEVIAVGISNLKVRHEALFVVNVAATAGVIAFIPDGFFSFSLRMNPILRVFWVLAAIILAVRYYRLRQERTRLATAPVRDEERENHVTVKAGCE